jgi:hypothetical protein
MHILLASLEEEHIGSSPIGPPAITAFPLMEGFDGIVLRHERVNDQQAGALLVFHPEENRFVIRHFEGRRRAEFYPAQFGWQSRRA